MGRLALVLIMALTLTAGVVTFSINKSKKATVEMVSGFQKYTTARNLSHTGVNFMLHKLDEGDTTYLNPLNAGQKVWIVKNALSGLCSVSVKLTSPPALDTVSLTSKSIFNDTTYAMKIRLQRFPKPFPAIGAAVGLASSPINFLMNGNPNIDGRDHNMDGTLTASRSTDTVGVSMTTAAESILVSAYRTKIQGDPTGLKIQPIDDPGSYVNEYINGADYTWTSGNLSGNYGSASAPVIGYVNGSVTFSGNGKFYGVLVVNGSIDLQGTFDIYGLVICTGDNNTIQTSAGTPEIHGGVIVTGTGSTFEMKGTADVQYCTAALNMAKYIPKLLAYKVMQWYE